MKGTITTIDTTTISTSGGCFSSLTYGLRVLILTAIIVSCSQLLAAQTRNVYVCDGGNFNLPPWQILKFDEDGSNGEVFISDNLNWPQDILFLESRDQVLISNLGSFKISRFNATSGAYINDFATGIGGPTRMKIGADGMLYVLQWSGNGRVWRYNLDGTFIDQFTDTGVNTSIGLDWDSAGNLYVSSYNGGFVRKFSTSGVDLGDFINTNLDGPTNIWFHNNGDLFVNDWDAGSVKRFDSQGNFLGVFITSVPQVEGVDFLSNGEILLGIGATSSVGVYSSSGTFLRNLVDPGELNLILPNAVVVRTEPSSGVVSPTVYKDIVIATPSVGVQFQISLKDHAVSAAIIEVYDSMGQVIKSLNIQESAQWNASDVPDGIYYLTVQLKDGAIARQKIMVQR